MLLLFYSVLQSCVKLKFRTMNSDSLLTSSRKLMMALLFPQWPHTHTHTHTPGYEHLLLRLTDCACSWTSGDFIGRQIWQIELRNLPRTICAYQEDCSLISTNLPATNEDGTLCSSPQISITQGHMNREAPQTERQYRCTESRNLFELIWRWRWRSRTCARSRSSSACSRTCWWAPRSSTRWSPRPRARGNASWSRSAATWRGSIASLRKTIGRSSG